MDGEYENPECASDRRIVLSRRPFLFGDFFFGPAKKKLLGSGSGRRPALSRKRDSKVQRLHLRGEMPSAAAIPAHRSRLTPFLRGARNEQPRAVGVVQDPPGAGCEVAEVE